MTGLDLATLAETNAARCRRWHPDGSEPWTLADWSNAMCGEAGEAANVIKKLRRLETGTAQPTSPDDRRVLAKQAGLEIADTVIYADLLAQELTRRYGGYDLSNLIVTKFNAVSHREGFPEQLALPWEARQ